MNDDVAGFQRAYFRDRIFELGSTGEDREDEYDRSKQLAEVWSQFATFERLQGNNDEAKSYTKTAINIWEKLIQDNAEDIEARENCASNQHNLGTICLENDDYDQAEISFERAVSLQEKLTTDHPDVPSLHLELSQKNHFRPDDVGNLHKSRYLKQPFRMPVNFRSLGHMSIGYMEDSVIGLVFFDNLNSSQ